MIKQSKLTVMLIALFCSCNKPEKSSDPTTTRAKPEIFTMSKNTTSPGEIHNSIIQWYDNTYLHTDTIFTRNQTETMAQRIESFLADSFDGDYSDTLMLYLENSGAFDSNGNLVSMYDIAAQILDEEANEQIYSAVKSIMTYKEPTGFIAFAKNQFVNLPLNPTETQKVAVYLDVLEHSYHYNNGREREMEVQSNGVDITVQIYRARYISSMDAVGSMEGFEKAMRNGASIHDAALNAARISVLYSAIASRIWDDQFGGNW